MTIEATAFARAGLLGNPSDGYFGKTISVSVRNFAARVYLVESPELRIQPHRRDVDVFDNLEGLVDRVNLTGYYGGTRLIKAAIKTFADYCGQTNGEFPRRNFTISYVSDIPRQIGLAGSSAIITATMKALMEFYSLEIPREILPGLILAAERDELGINAGLQDRVIQVFGGCVYMDFDRELMESKGYGLYQPLDAKQLPNFFIAYKRELGKESGAVLSHIRRRYERGDAEVLTTLAKIASLADEGRKALEQQNWPNLKRLMNENFDLRSEIMDVGEKNRALVTTARRCGASAKFAGSGGAIIGIYDDEAMLQSLILEMNALDTEVIEPEVLPDEVDGIRGPSPLVDSGTESRGQGNKGRIREGTAAE